MTEGSATDDKVLDAISHGRALNDSWYDTDGKLDSPSVVTSERYTDAVGDKLTPSDSDRLDSHHCASESSWSKFTDVHGCNGRSSSHTYYVRIVTDNVEYADSPKPRTNRPTIICATENDEQMMIAPTVNHRSP